MTIPKIKFDFILILSLSTVVLCLGVIIKTLDITGDSLPSSPTILNSLTNKI